MVPPYAPPGPAYAGPAPQGRQPPVRPMASLIIAAGDGFVLHSTLDPVGYAPESMLNQVIQLLLAARRSGASD